MQLSDVFRQSPDLALLLHVADLVMGADHDGHNVGVELGDRVGDEPTDENDDQPDRKQAHRHGTKCQQQFLLGHQPVEMIARNRQRRIERWPEMHACRKVVGNRERPRLKDDVGAVFLLECFLHVEETIRLDRHLDKQRARFLLGSGRVKVTGSRK